MDTLTVGVDIGTTSVKALAVNDGGAVVASARMRHRLITGAGRLEHDADEAWRRNVWTVYNEVAAGRHIRAGVIAAMVPSLTAVDGEGLPRGPGLLYGDVRGQGLPGASPAASGEAGGFLGWLAANVPNVAGFWPAQAVGTHALCNRPAIDYATAFCTSPLFDGRDWSADALRDAGAEPRQLPRVVTELEPVGRIVDGEAAVGPGTVDALAAQYVAGADQPGDVLVVLGATMIVWLVADGWVECPGLWTVPYTVPGTCIVGGASNAGGLFVDWVRGLVADTGVDAADALDPHDIPLWLPYVRGERTPLHQPRLRGELGDVHVGHGTDAVLRAAHEASAFVLRRVLELADATTPADLAPQRIVAVGGGVRNRRWVGALADGTGLPVAVAEVPDASALGAAFVARCVAGLEGDPTDGRRWARTARVREPDPRWLVACDERYERFVQRTLALVEELED
jgi:xylulokinase